MDTNENDSRSVGRRRTLQMLAAGLTATGLGLVAACNSSSSGGGGAAPASGGGGGAAASGGGNCADQIDDASRQLRKSLQYKAKSDNPDKVCSKCAQFTPDKYGDCGGGCKLITGPVKPAGGCLSFAPIGAPAGSASAKTPT